MYKLGDSPYFYDDFVENKDSEIFAHDPHLGSDYIYNKKPLVEIWCEIIGIQYNNSLPKIYFTQREEEVAWRLLKSDRPLLLIQGNEVFPRFPNLNFDWTKDVPIEILQKISDVAIKKGYLVLQLRNQNQPGIMGATTLSLNLRVLLAGLKNINKILVVDSYISHACAAVNKQAVVTFLSTSPETNSYSLHKNIKGKITENIKDTLDTYSPFFDIKGKILERPVSMRGTYNADEIIKVLDL